jgi:hypothetical protein
VMLKEGVDLVGPVRWAEKVGLFVHRSRQSLLTLNSQCLHKQSCSFSHEVGLVCYTSTGHSRYPAEDGQTIGRMSKAHQPSEIAGAPSPALE